MSSQCLAYPLLGTPTHPTSELLQALTGLGRCKWIGHGCKGEGGGGGGAVRMLRTDESSHASAHQGLSPGTVQASTL